MMSRWWAPEQVLDEPDEVVKAAFLPLNDGNEMPSALLGVHRAVAGAISKRVSQGLIDERGLVDAMAQMRGKVIGGALEAISKSVDPTYAGLLLRDWCDAAELGALRVYRTAVSKGVAPVVAAERAAAAYGVPSESMGKYLSVAAEPKSAPSVVNDTADRVLMESISKLHRSESEPVQETVAKASVFREDDVVRHPAGSSRGGQFAPENAGRKKATRPSVLERYGLTETIPTGVQGMIDDLEEQEKPVKTTPSRDSRTAARARQDQAKQRRARSKTAQQRRERASRGRRPASESVPETRPPATRTRTRTPATRASTRAQTTRDLNEYITTRQPQRVQQEEPVNPFDPELAGNDLMRKSKYGSSEHYEHLGEDVVFQVPNSMWKHLSSQLDAAATSLNGRPVRMARLGNLVDDVDSGDVLGFDEQAEASRSAAGALEVEEIQHQMRLPAGGLEIDETPIYSVPGMDLNAQAVYNERIVDEQLEMEKDNPSAVGAYVPYAPYGQDPPDDAPDSYLVTHRWSANPGHSDPPYVPTPQVVELVVHDASGEVVGSGESGYRSLNPDQAYRVSVDDDPYGGTHATPELMWDPKSRALVMRYHLHPVDEDELGSFGKARQWRESDVKRDALGQFAPENSPGFTLPGMVERMMPEKPSLSETGRQQRLERTNRKRRQGERRARAARTRLVPTQREQSETRKATRAPATRAPATRARTRAPLTRQPLTRTATGERAELVLAPGSSYRAFDQESFHSMLETVDRQDLLDLQREGGRINLNSMMREQLFTGMDDEKSVVRRLRNNVDADLTAQETFEHNKEVVLPGYVGADHHLLQERVNRIFDENPDVAVVEIVHDDDDQIRMQWSTMPVNQQVMVDVPDEYDPDKNYQLAYVGTYQLRDLYGQSPEGLRSIGGMMDEIHLGGGFALNPTVNHYRVISPTVQRYRAEEQ